MTDTSLEEAINSAGGAVELLRDLGVGQFTELPDEFSHWIEEQRAWQESVALMDLSYHMTDLEISGPDALELYDDVAVNNFDDFQVGQAKQLVIANPDGKFIGDGILFYLDDEEFLSVGAAPAHNWLDYHAQVGEYDVTAEMRPRPVSMDGDPKYFRYQVQGPDAVELTQAVADDPLPDIGFFNFETIEIDGTTVNALRHGMAGEPGYELFGPYERGEDVRETLLDVGEEYDIRQVGAQAYQTPTIKLGWIPLPVPAIYSGEETKDFREWLPMKRGMLSIGGSFNSDDISDYYVTPIEMGYEHVIDFDKDFIGKEALEEEVENPRREKVTLEWNSEDVIDVYASLFRDGETYKFLDFPHPRWAACPYETVTKDDEQVGVSTDKGYIYNEREMLSLAMIDREYAEPGTEVTLLLGEPKGTDNPVVERHAQKEIRATIAPSPYREDKR
jgi:glycine cleavage system aminomethyltransferase T